VTVANKNARVKTFILAELEHFIYEKVTQAFVEREIVIGRKNAVICSQSQPAFLYKGGMYAHNGLVWPKNRQAKLVPELHDEMEILLKDRVAVESYEKIFVMGFIRSVLNHSYKIGDMLEFLPESVHYPISKLLGSDYRHVPQLTPDVITEMLEKHEKAIDLMKTRMVLNLLT
jgi:hypothetical protein